MHTVKPASTRRPILRSTTVLIALLFSTATFAASGQQALQDLCARLLDSLPADVRASRLVILPFADSTGKGANGAAIAEYLIVNLRDKGIRNLVDRAEFLKVLQEIELSQSDMADTAASLKIGRMLAARFLLTGSITNLFGNYRVTARIINIETTQLVAAGATNIAPVALDGMTKELLGEKNRVTSSMFRSLVVPGWGQFYADQPVRGAISLAVCAGGVGYFVYTIVAQSSALASRDEWINFGNSTDIEDSTTAHPGYYETVYLPERARRNQAYDQAYDRMKVGGIITGCLWALNIVDASIAGAQAKKKFRPYFQANMAGDVAAGVCVKF